MAERIVVDLVQDQKIVYLGDVENDHLCMKNDCHEMGPVGSLVMEDHHVELADSGNTDLDCPLDLDSCFADMVENLQAFV
jgi:hypothetical protein